MQHRDSSQFVVMTCVTTLAAIAMEPTAQAAWVNGFEWDGPPPRHFAGLQVGGSVPVALDYRYNVWGPVFLDAGVFAAADGPAMVTGGAIVNVYERDRWVVYLGAGASQARVWTHNLLFG
jgi:hypothetical protein